MPGMPGVLLDHVDKDSAQAERLVTARDGYQLIQAPIRQHLIGRCLRALDGRRPQCVQRLRGVANCRLEVPVVVLLDGGPHLGVRLTEQLVGEVVVLDQGQVARDAPLAAVSQAGG